MEMTSEEIMKSSTWSTCSPRCKCHNTSVTGWTITHRLQTCLSCSAPLFKLVSQTATRILYSYIFCQSIILSDSSLCISWSCNSTEKKKTQRYQKYTHTPTIPCYSLCCNCGAGSDCVSFQSFCLTLPPPQGRWYNGCCKSRSQFQEKIGLSAPKLVKYSAGHFPKRLLQNNSTDERQKPAG